MGIFTASPDPPQHAAAKEDKQGANCSLKPMAKAGIAGANLLALK